MDQQFLWTQTHTLKNRTLTQVQRVGRLEPGDREPKAQRPARGPKPTPDALDADGDGDAVSESVFSSGL